MPVYTFRTRNPDKDREIITVAAKDEFEARDLAMHKAWGSPDGKVLLKRPYYGRGLSLLSTTES